MTSSISVQIEARVSLWVKALPVLTRFLAFLPIPVSWKVGVVNAYLKWATVSYRTYFCGRWSRWRTTRLSDRMQLEYTPQ